MLPRNKVTVLLLVLLVALGVCAGAQTISTTVKAPSDPGGQNAAPPPANAQPSSTENAQQPAQSGQPARPAGDAPNQPGDTVRVPAQNPQGQEPSRQEGGVFVFKKDVDEVQLYATVVDDRHRLVTGLTRNDFAVFEDGAQQRITSFDRRDVPVALGIVIDNSGSMREKRTAVNQAAINLVKSSNPNDEVFVVNFNDEYYLDQDFTSQIPLLKDALERIESRGGTALYDAVVASAEHLKKNARLEKKVLLVVTDGEDNASRESLEQAIRRLQAEDGPTVYTVGLLGEERQRRARRALSAMAEQTGGVSFFPKNLAEVDSITQAVAHDIRNQYIIGYKPSNSRLAGGYRTVRVDAHAPGYKRLQVRTRSGYYAGQERASK
jgi:VWFA-related protein